MNHPKVCWKLLPISISSSPDLVKKSSPKIAREFAKKVEDYINEHSQQNSVNVFVYSDIAYKTGVSKKIVKDLLVPKGGSSDGITVINQQVESINKKWEQFCVP